MAQFVHREGRITGAFALGGYLLLLGTDIVALLAQANSHKTSIGRTRKITRTGTSGEGPERGGCCGLPTHMGRFVNPRRMTFKTHSSPYQLC